MIGMVVSHICPRLFLRVSGNVILQINKGKSTARRTSSKVVSYRKIVFFIGLLYCSCTKIIQKHKGINILRVIVLPEKKFVETESASSQESDALSLSKRSAEGSSTNQFSNSPILQSLISNLHLPLPNSHPSKSPSPPASLPRPSLRRQDARRLRRSNNL